MPRRGASHLAVLSLVAGALSIACTRPVPDAPQPVGFDLAAARAVDLTHAFDADTIYWPTAPSRFELAVLFEGITAGGWFYSAKAFASPEHGGTHLDAPIHFFAERQTVDEIPLARLIAPAVVVDVRAQASADADYALDLAALDAWEANHGTVPEGSIVLLWTGWDERWPDVARYLGDDTPGETSNLHFPSFGPAATARLVGERRVAAIGVDTASIDVGQAHAFPVHQITAEANVPGLENLTGLGDVPATGAWVVALPVKIRGGTGGPARVVALVPNGG
jgi:kynurenine formamidase